jgi:hypothetical protein
MAAGYSGTPLAKKLGIKPGSAVCLINAPGGFEATLDGLPEDASVTDSLRGKAPFDVMVFFTISLDGLRAAILKLRARMAPACGLWIVWPKKASGVATDLTENLIRDLALQSRLVDNKVCAVDQTWSGLRLVIRVKDR